MIAHDDVVSIEIASWNEVGSTAYVEWRYRLADGSLDGVPGRGVAWG